jgi:parvulin-like peptidyl-prolyl isomerase
MIKKRLLSFLGAAAITAALTFAVVSLSPSNGFTSGTMQEGLCYEATGVAPDAIVASLNGNGASADLVAYWIGYDVSYLNSYMQYYTGSSINWDDTLSDGMSVADYVKASVLSSVKQHLVLENLASKYGVTLTAEQEAAMAESDQSYIDQYGSEEAFEAEIAKLGMRRETYDRVARSNYLYQNLYQLYNTEGSALYASDEDLAVYAADQNYITADHILLSTKDLTTGEALTDEQKAEKKALAEEIKQKLDACEGDIDELTALFQELADQYSEDPGRETHPTGYTFTTGSMVQEFEDAAYALSEGEVSEIVESSFGYHILLRLPLDKAAAADEVRDDYFTNFITEQVDAAAMATSADYDKLDPQTIYEAIVAAQAEG